MTDANSDNTIASPKPAKDRFVWMVLLITCLVAPLLSFATDAYGGIIGALVCIVLNKHYASDIPKRRFWKSIGYGIGILALSIILTPSLRIVYSYIAGYVSGFFGGFFGN